MVVSILDMSRVDPSLLPLPIGEREERIGPHPSLRFLRPYWDAEEGVWVLPQGTYTSNKYYHRLTTRIIDVAPDFSYVLIICQLYNSRYGVSRKVYVLRENPHSPFGYDLYQIRGKAGASAWNISKLSDLLGENSKKFSWIPVQPPDLQFGE